MNVTQTFVDECRECAREQPAITAEHIARIGGVISKLHEAAQESPGDFGHWWREVEAVISDRSLSVKARLALLGPIGDAIGRAFGREDTIVPFSGGVH
jgi:hypothetical protein